MCPTRPSKDIPGIPATRPSKGIPDIPDIPVIHDLPAFPGISTNFSTSRVSTPLQHSPIRMHILHSTVRLVSTENSIEYQLDNTNILQTLHSSKKGRCCDMGHVEDVKDIADIPIGHNAIFVEDVEDITKMSR